MHKIINFKDALWTTIVACMYYITFVLCFQFFFNVNNVLCGKLQRIHIKYPPPHKKSSLSHQRMTFIFSNANDVKTCTSTEGQLQLITFVIMHKYRKYKLKAISHFTWLLSSGILVLPFFHHCSMGFASIWALLWHQEETLSISDSLQMSFPAEDGYVPSTFFLQAWSTLLKVPWDTDLHCHLSQCFLKER